MRKERIWKLASIVAVVVAMLAATLTGLNLFIGGEEPMVARSYSTDVYMEQGGDKLVVASGGEIEIQSGGTIDVQSGATTDFSGGVDLDGSNLVIDADGDTILIEGSDDVISTTLGAGTGKFAVYTGNLVVGDETPTVTQDGEDAYIEGQFEVDGEAQFDGAVDANSSATFDGGLVDIGGGNYDTASGDNDLGVAGVIEVDGELEVDGAIDADSTSDFAGTATFSKANGNAIVVSAGGAIAANGSAFTLAAAEKIAIDGDTTNQTQTGGALDIDVGSTTANVSGLDVLVTTDDGTATGTDVFLGKLAMVQDDADADAKGLTITANASANAAAGSYEYGVSYDCTEDTATACTDGLLLTSSGVALGMTDAIDASDSNILNALNIGDNLILGGDDSVSIGAADDTLILKSNDSTPTFMGTDASAPSDTIYDTDGAGAIVIGSADVTNVTVNSDVGLTFANNSESIADGTDGAFDFTRNDSGTVTLTASDDDATAAMTVDPGGAAALTLGSADVTSVNVVADADMQLQNGATGNVDLSFHDYADTTDDDMAHALLRTNCTATGTGAENCDFTVGVVEGGNAADTRLNIDADAGVTVGSSNASPVTLTAGTTNAILSEPAAAGSGGDMLDLAHTFAAMDGSDTSLGIDLNLTGADATGTGNLLYGLDADLTTADAQVTEKAIDVSDTDWDYAIDTGPVPIVSSAARFMDDFFGDTVNGDWYTELSGTDPQAVQAIAGNAVQYGEYQLTSGDDNAGGCAASCEGIAVGTHWSADQGSLIFEARLHIDSAVGNDVVCVGLVDDAASVEMPATISGAVITTNSDDALVFCFDTEADTDQWYVIGVAGTTDATGNALSGVAPTADTYQVLRIEADAGGADARFYIDGSLVGTLTANAITAADLLTPLVMVDTNADESNVVDVDYIFVSAQRQ